MVTALVSLLSSVLVLLYPMTAVGSDTADATPARVRVVVTTRDGFASNYDFVARQPNLGTFTIDADAATLDRLRRDPRVAAITPDLELRPALAESTTQIHAEAAWASGVTGAGQTIVVIDTGVDGAHPMLSGRVLDEACFTDAGPGGAGACPNGLAQQFGAGAAAPCSGVGCDHGTHVASVAAGRTLGSLRGVAPDASVVAVQVFTQTPSGPTTSIGEVLAALEWAYGQRTRFSIAAINLSIASAGPVTTPCADAAVEQAVARLREVDIAVVAASGNGGSTNDLAYPACVRGVVSASSVSASGAPSSFANRAPELSLFAPGETITAAAPGSGTQTKSGTSQATPHISGALALFRQIEPTASFDTLVGLFDRTADVVVGPDGRRAAAGMLRIDRALDPRYRQPSVAVSRSSPPILALDALRVLPGRVELAGSVVDPASVLPATLTVVLDGAPAVATQTVAGDGDTQRFTLTVPIEGGRPLELCIDIRGARAETASRMTCTVVTGPDGPPIGSLDVVQAGLGALVVEGWAIDPDVSTPIGVHVYVDGVLMSGITADRIRDDVGRAYPDYGAAHGFGATLAVAGGPHIVCVYGIDADDDENALVGCRNFEMPTGSPFGALDDVQTAFGTVTVRGWAIDPDVSTAVDVHIYVDDQLVTATRANGTRDDVGRAYPDYGAAHGFGATLAVAGGPHVVCVYGIDADGDENALLGCRRVETPTGAPFGALDAVRTTASGVIVSGWAIDPDASAPIQVHVYADGRLVRGASTGSARADVNAAYPQFPSDHGYDVTIELDAGPHVVCVYGINVGPGPNALLGCRTA
ncbi:MAG TPA: S8 family serine peptidase [Acidimicrobiales bacterium]|nr:S8 family serine peptidase [Acidimicrobiales bacterium]